MAPVKKRFGEILMEMGAIDQLQLQSALGHQQRWGIPLGKAVVDLGFCSRDDVLRGLSIQTGHPVMRLDGQQMDSRLAGVLPVKTAERLRVVPLALDGKRKEVLRIAVAAPGGLETLDGVLSVSGKSRLVVHLAHDDEIERAIGRLYYGRTENAPPPTERLGPRPVVATEAEIDFAAQKDVPLALSRPVRMFGWNEPTMRALGAMIERGGVKAKPLPEEELFALTPDDILIASTLGLQTVLAPGVQVKAKLIICGVREDLDVSDAKKLGARMYLRPPFSTEQLVGAIQRLS